MNTLATAPERKVKAIEASRILVVEDERIVARSLQKQLTSLGYEVVASVPSGEQAIQLSRELRPDLVLMDISLEGPLDGVAAAAIIRKQFRLPVVYLTAYSNREILERAKVTEPFGYILKPYEERELHVVIETALFKHRMERHQQDREQWFVATLKSIGDAVVATDEEGLVTYMNPLAERLTGWVKHDAFGRSLREVVRFVHEDSRHSVDSALDHPMNGTPSAGILLIAKDRSERDVENCVSLIADDDGKALGKVVVFRDVTSRKRLEVQYRQSKKMEAIGRLAGGMAHSLNNLMTTVLGHTELMLNVMKIGDPFFASALEIRKAAMRTATLTQRLLAFGRKQLLTLSALDLNAVVGGLEQVLQHLQCGVRVDLKLQPFLGLTTADSDQLEEAIVTLVRNACEAMRDGGRVTVETSDVELGPEYTEKHPEVRPGPYVLLAVSDTGVGMSRDAIDNLFEPFQTQRAGVGAGLGLAAVYGFVKQCGGDIEVKSNPNRGTVFRLFLPRVVSTLEECVVQS